MDTTAPAKLYKYVVPERIDVLRHHLIRFTPAHDTNDPFELRPMVKHLMSETRLKERLYKGASEILKKRFDGYPQPLCNLLLAAMDTDEFKKEKERHPLEAVEMVNAVTPGALSTLEVALQSELGILSLTEDPWNVLMWAHYAANHTGFVIEFNARDTWFHSRRSDKDDFFQVRPVLYSSSNAKNFLVELDANDIIYAKQQEWRYERE